MKKILVIGSTVADIIIKLPTLPTTAEDVNIESQEMSLGGCAYNVSDMIRHFNAPYRLFSPIGTGIYGDFIRNQLAAKGLASPMPTPAAPNGCCYCFVEDSGERTFVCDHGAEYLFKKEWFDNLNTDKIASIYICGLEIEDKTGEIIVEFLEDNPEIPIFFAPGPRISFIDENLMKRIFTLKPIIHLNKSEVCEYTEETNIENAARVLYTKTHNTVIVTGGANGAYYFNGDDFVCVPAVKAACVVDTIGAGDSHVGSVMACLHRGDSLEVALEKANAAAALVVAHKGATLPDEFFNIG